MLAASISFLTPWAGLLGLLALLPLGALVLAERRLGRARRALRLPSPDGGDRVRRGALGVAVVLLLVLTAMQPALETTTALRARTDAQAFVVLDTSRSMLAAPSPGAPTRLRTARRDALALVNRLPGIPVGVATFTDRVLPDLFPTSDTAAFDSVVDAVRIESPPPREVNTVATDFDALTALATQGFFTTRAKRRAVVLVTDGESRAFDPAAVAGTLSQNGIRLAVVRVGGGGDRVWKPNGKPEANYRPDPAGAETSLARLRAAAGETGGADAASLVSRALGRGPTERVGVEPRSQTLAPFAAILALVPLALLLGLTGVSPGWLRGVTSRRPGSDAREVRA
jgi:VWA domain-containing protein